MAGAQFRAKSPAAAASAKASCIAIGGAGKRRREFAITIAAQAMNDSERARKKRPASPLWRRYRAGTAVHRLIVVLHDLRNRHLDRKLKAA